MGSTGDLEQIEWIGTPEACARLGVTLRTLYRFIDEGQLPAYKMGRVIRLQAQRGRCLHRNALRIVPGTLEHLYPDPKTAVGSRSHEKAGPDEAERRLLSSGTPGSGTPGSATHGSGTTGRRRAGHRIGAVSSAG
jgi:excisionase family DNA binding protein